MALIILIIFWAILPFALIPLTIILFVDRYHLKKQLNALRSPPSIAPPVQTPRPQNAYTASTPAPAPVKKSTRPTGVVFALGASFIALAGMIFATTAWWRLPPVLRAGIVLLVTVLFFAASQIAERQFSLRQTGRALFALGCLFIPVTFLTIGYFGLFGTYLSIHGCGRRLLWMLAFGMAGGACAVGTGRYRSALFHWAAYACGALSTLYLLLFLTDSADIFALLLALVSVLLNILYERLPETERRKLGVLSFVFGGGAWIAGAWALAERTAWTFCLLLACAVLTGLASTLSLRGKRWMRYVQPVLVYTLCSGIARFSIPSYDWTGIALTALVTAAFFLCRAACLRTAWSDALTLLWLIACVRWNPDWPWFLLPDLLLCAFVVFLALERAPSRRRIAATWALPFLPLVFLPHLVRNSPLNTNQLLLVHASLVCAACAVLTLAGNEKTRPFELPLLVASSVGTLGSAVLFSAEQWRGVSLLLALFCAVWCVRLAALLTGSAQEGRSLAFYFSAGSLIAFAFAAASELFPCASVTRLLYAPAAVSLILFCVGELLRRECPGAFLAAKLRAFTPWAMLALCALIGFGGWFTGFLLLAGCLTLFFLRQSLPGSGRIPLTVAAVCLCGAWWTQPFWSVPEAVRVEWMLLPLIAAPLALRLLLWRDHPRQMEAIQFVPAAFCSLILGFAALLRASTAIVLGVCAAGLVIASLLDRLRKRWFLLGGITLLCLAVYATRVFWLSLAWWIYLLVAGVTLIAAACINERSGLIGRFAEKIRQWEW